MIDDALAMRLAAERIRRKREAAQIRQAILIVTNLGYSTVIAAAVDLLTSFWPKSTLDCCLIALGFVLLTLTLIFAPAAEF